MSLFNLESKTLLSFWDVLSVVSVNGAAHGHKKLICRKKAWRPNQRRIWSDLLKAHPWLWRWRVIGELHLCSGHWLRKLINKGLKCLFSPICIHNYLCGKFYACMRGIGYNTPILKDGLGSYYNNQFNINLVGGRPTWDKELTHF